jgi:hypothetical protein
VFYVQSSLVLVLENFFLNNSRRTAVFIALEEKGTETRTAQFIEGKPGENLYINRSTARHKERREG